MKARIILLIFPLLSFLTGCEKAVHFSIESVPPKLVVEATIENGQAPMVYLSRSLGYFSKITVDTLAANFVHQAKVLLSNGTLAHQLKEYAIPVGNGKFFYYYSNDPASASTAFMGEVAHDYTLRIEVDGKVYTSSTRIPALTKRIDSVWARPAPAGNAPDAMSLMIRATDPPGFGDYIRYFTKRNNGPFLPGFNSVFDDQVIDGTTYEVPVDQGVDRNQTLSEGFSYFHKGDTVTLKLCNINKATFDFWRTMEFTYQSVGNPFSSPTTVLGNISGGGLGYFGGYGAQYRTIIIPH